MTAKEIKRTLQSEFVRTLRKPFVDAVKAYGLIKPSDKVAVCISGGKDSMLLALLLQDLQHTVDFDLVFLAMDPGYAPEGRKHLEENAKRLDIPLEIFDTDVLRRGAFCRASVLPVRKDAPRLSVHRSTQARLQQDRARSSL